MIDIEEDLVLQEEKGEEAQGGIGIQDHQDIEMILDLTAIEAEKEIEIWREDQEREIQENTLLILKEVVGNMIGQEIDQGINQEKDSETDLDLLIKDLCHQEIREGQSAQEVVISLMIDNLNTQDTLELKKQTRENLKREYLSKIPMRDQSKMKMLQIKI